MKIYIAHSRNFNFQKELYEPIQNSPLTKEHNFIFPHEKNDRIFNSKEFFQNGCDLVIADVSYPAIGLGIELGWADIIKVPVVCIYKEGSKISGSLKIITDKFFEYSSTKDLVDKITQIICSSQ